MPTNIMSKIINLGQKIPVEDIHEDQRVHQHRQDDFSIIAEKVASRGS